MTAGTIMDFTGKPDGKYGDYAVVSGSYDLYEDGSPLPYRVVLHEERGREGRDALDNRTATRVFMVEGEDEPALAREGLLTCPYFHIDRYDGMNVEEIMDREQVGFGKWRFTLSYKSTAPSLDFERYTISVDTGGATILQTHALGERVYHEVGVTPTAFPNAVNVHGNEIKGTQRVIPSLRIDIRARIAAEHISNKPLHYTNLVTSLVGYTNDAPMFPEPIGGLAPTFAYDTNELLFLGKAGEIHGRNPVVTFKFLASKNFTDLEVGNITGIEKKGHEIIWFEHATVLDGTSNRQSKAIRAVHVSQIYGEADLTQMKIGIAPA